MESSNAVCDQVEIAEKAEDSGISPINAPKLFKVEREADEEQEREQGAEHHQRREETEDK